LNSGVNDRRGRGFFRSIVSILNILSGAVPLMVDVRQTGGSPTAKSGNIGWECRPARWDDLAELRLLAEREDRRIIAWSDHERAELPEHLTSSADRQWFADHVVNAIPIAKRWLRQVHPELRLEKDPTGWMRGRHQLKRYFGLIGYEVPAAFGPGHSADRIRAVRLMLAKRGGQYTALTTVVKAKWVKALKHNLFDCDGLRHLMVCC